MHDQINGYTSQYHHGENMGDTTPDQIDPIELTGYVRRTLRIVNAVLVPRSSGGGPAPSNSA